MQLLPTAAWADGLAVAKVYDPCVQPREKEFELHAHFLADDDESVDGNYLYKLGYGQSLNDRWFVEGYLIGGGEQGSGSDLEGYELELKCQLTEQGEYSADWGLLLELEHEPDGKVWESSVTLLTQKDLQRVSLLSNLSLVYESGDTIEEEWETTFAGQARYRYQRYLEPGFEVFLSQGGRVAGPFLAGEIRLAGAQKVFWQVAFLVGMNAMAPDMDMKINMEYEF